MIKYITFSGDFAPRYDIWWDIFQSKMYMWPNAKFDSVVSHSCTIIIENLWFTGKFSVFMEYNASLFINLLIFTPTCSVNKMHIGHLCASGAMVGNGVTKMN